ncbi:MAG: hypothetical protein J2P17_18330, partial [Mycobacterium sp.]|nr:hypothetical protein [Mycobacterium sp.]
PIDVSSWQPETLDQHVKQLRQLYLDTLTHWPQAPSQQPKRQRPWSIWTTPRSDGTNMSTLPLGTATQSSDSASESITPKLRRQLLTPEQSVGLNPEVVRKL